MPSCPDCNAPLSPATRCTCHSFPAGSARAIALLGLLVAGCGDPAEPPATPETPEAPEVATPDEPPEVIRAIYGMPPVDEFDRPPDEPITGPPEPLPAPSPEPEKKKPEEAAKPDQTAPPDEVQALYGIPMTED